MRFFVDNYPINSMLPSTLKHVFTIFLLTLLYQVRSQCSYDKSRDIHVDATQVAGSSDLIDFPLYLAITSPEFRTTAEGGLIENANGFDVSLLLKDCRCWMDFIIHSYDGVTGTFEIYVTVPSLSTSEDTEITFFYGNALVTADPSTDTTYNSTVTADWTSTQVENRTNPGTFYSMGDQKEADCSGPGGIDTMDGLSNLVLWLKADCGVEDGSGFTSLNGGTVGAWRDQSGFGIDAIEASNQPDYETNQINGEPALNFTSSDGDRLLSSGVSDANQYMIFIVAEPESYASTNIGLIHGAPNGDAFRTNTNSKSIGMWVSNGGDLWGRLIETDGTFVNYNQTSAVPTGSYFIMTNYADGVNTTGQHLRGVDASATATYDGTVQEWTDFGIGRQGNESWDGHIAEVIAFNRHLNDSERGQVENYLASKYGVEIPRLTGSTGPAGIGENDGTSMLEVWLDANDLDGDGTIEASSEGGQTAGTISTWSDKSGHGYDLTTGSATYTDSNTGLNDMASVDFNGTSDFLQSANINLASANTLEYFIVFDDASVNAGNGNALVSWETAANEGGFELTSRVAAGRLRSSHYTGGAYDDVDLNGFTTTDPYLLNNSFGPDGRDHIRNGTSIASDGTAITLNSPTAPLVFGRHHSTTDRYFTAEVSEFISYSMELNGAEKEIVQQYLSAKYDIALAGTDYYAGHDASFVVGIQGIGTSNGTLPESHVESNASGGLTITMANGSFENANEYLFSGNDGTTGGTSTDNLTSVPSVEQRMSKVWYLDKTGIIDAELTFNIQESVGTTSFPEGDGYVLLYSPTFPLDFQDYTADHSITATVGNQNVSFTVPDAQLLDGYYTVGTTNASNSVLPVVLLFFNAENCENSVCVSWRTATEINNDFFEVEKSSDGENWTSITKINGAGNSSERLDYSYVDNFPGAGTHFYRLKQTDFDGSYSYSENILVEFELDANFSFAPNPTEDQLIIAGDRVSIYQLSLYKINGEKVPTKASVVSQDQLTLNLADLPSGIYLLKLTYSGTNYTQRIIKK